MSRTLIAVVSGLALALVACASDEPEVSEEEQVAAEQREELDEPENGEDDEDGEDEGAAEDTVEFVAGDNYYEDLPDEVAAGAVEFVMENEGSAEHDMVIEELGDEEVVPMTAGGETDAGTAELEPGTYTLYCAVPGHREAGMEATIEVVEG